MSNDRAICTIITKNYVAFARTLVDSFLSFHPDYQCYVLIVDDYAGFIHPEAERFEIVKLAELGIPNLPEFCFKYDLKELCTASKGHLLDYLIHEKSVNELLYLDPDILVTGTLTGLFDRLDACDIVLTPHLDTDYPDDDLLPDDGHILRAGQFNLGFLGINSGDNAKAFLNWWKPKLLKKCVVDVANGFFVDQKFIDFAPVFFRNVLIEKDVGYNVAYWNLHSRRISERNGVWQCNDAPLYFFHFSGYVPDSHAISKYIPENVARYHFSNRPDLRKLFAEYKARLNANGYQQTISWPYTFACFKSGEFISYELRQHYRSQTADWQSLGDPFESDELKGRAVAILDSATRLQRLNAILNSRTGRWLSRDWCYNSLAWTYHLFVRLFGDRRAAIKQPEKRWSPRDTQL